nr:hypothetical protein [Tanacetum cinerariifolium]
MENQFDVQNHLVEIHADDHDLLVNSDNKNDDMLVYEFGKYSDDEDADGTHHAEDADGTNHSDLKLVKRGITKLYKFRRENGKPGGIKIKKVDKESRDKLWDEITQYFDVDLTVKKLVMHRLGRVNKDGEFTDDEIRSVRDKLKEADDKIKEGTLNLDDGTDAMTVVFDKKKGDYARGVGSEVTYKRIQSSFVVRDKDAGIQKKYNGLVTLEKEPIKTVGPRKMPKSRRNGSQDSQSQGNVSPTQE